MPHAASRARREGRRAGRAGGGGGRLCVCGGGGGGGATANSRAAPARFGACAVPPRGCWRTRRVAGAQRGEEGRKSGRGRCVCVCVASSHTVIAPFAAVCVCGGREARANSRAAPARFGACAVPPRGCWCTKRAPWTMCPRKASQRAPRGGKRSWPRSASTCERWSTPSGCAGPSRSARRRTPREGLKSATTS